MKKIPLIIFLLLIGMTNLFSQEYSFVVDSGYVNVKGGVLFYEAAGKGEYIMLLHDGMVNRQIWDEQFPILAKNYRVIRYDRRGYGKSSDPQTQYSHIDDLNQVFLQLNIAKAVVFGMSSGGRLAIDFTLTYPEKVKAIVLVGAVVSGFGYTSHMNTRGGSYNQQVRSSDKASIINFIDKILTKFTQGTRKPKKR